MTVGIGEAGSAHPPRPVHRPVEQLHAPRCELRAHRIRIVYPDAQLEARPGLRNGDSSGIDQVAYRGKLEQVDDHVVELERCGVLVLPDRRQVEHALVERFRPLRILDEQRDGANAFQRGTHFPGSEPGYAATWIRSRSAARRESACPSSWRTRSRVRSSSWPIASSVHGSPSNPKRSSRMRRSRSGSASSALRTPCRRSDSSASSNGSAASRSAKRSPSSPSSSAPTVWFSET